MSYQWFDALGNLGVALIVGSYLALQLGRLKSEDVRYSIANAIGASLILVSLYFEFNLSAFVIELFWVLISGVGFYRAWRARSPAPAASDRLNGS